MLPQSARGFGALVVSMLASGTQDHRFEPGQSHQIFWVKKIHRMPSFGGEGMLKNPVIYVDVGITGQIHHPFLAHNSILH
jgi:hypothetical protein